MTDTIYKFLERAGLLLYWMLMTAKSLLDFLTDSETKRKYYERYLKKILGRKT